MHKNNRFSNYSTIGKNKRTLKINKRDYEFATGFPHTVGRNDKSPKTDQGLLQPDQNLNYNQSPPERID